MVFIREQIRWKVYLFYQYLRISSSRLVVTMSLCSLRDLIKIFLINCVWFLKNNISNYFFKSLRHSEASRIQAEFFLFSPKKVGTAQLTRLGIPLGMELGTLGRFWFKKRRAQHFQRSLIPYFKMLMVPHFLVYSWLYWGVMVRGESLGKFTLFRADRREIFPSSVWDEIPFAVPNNPIKSSQIQVALSSSH